MTIPMKQQHDESMSSARKVDPADVTAARRGGLDIYTRAHVEAVRWFLDYAEEAADDELTQTASHVFGELLDLLKRDPAVTLGAVLRTRFDSDIAPLKRIFVRTGVIASLGLHVADEEEPLRVDIQTDCLIAGTWPADRKAQDELLRTAGVRRNRTRDIIREIFLQPRAAYEPDDVMRMLGISDRMFADIVEESGIARINCKVPFDLLLKIVDDIFGMQRIESALGQDFETFFSPLCRHETITITAPRYVIAAARYVTDDFETANVFDRDSPQYTQHLSDIEIQIPGFIDALNCREKAALVVRGRNK